MSLTADGMTLRIQHLGPKRNSSFPLLLQLARSCGPVGITALGEPLAVRCVLAGSFLQLADMHEDFNQAITKRVQIECHFGTSN